MNMTIKLKLSTEEIKLIAEEINNIDNSELIFFLEKILKEAANKTKNLEKVLDNFQRINPFVGEQKWNHLKFTNINVF